MEPENSQDTPLGVLLITTYWIFIGIIILAMLSSNRSNNMLSMMPTVFGIFFIILGWGVLTLKTWAYYISLVFSIIGSISLLFIGPGFIYMIVSGYFENAMMSMIYFLFVPMAWYLFKNGKLFVKQQAEEVRRRCPNCGRVIPFDSRLCPYCGKRFEALAVKKEDYKDSTFEERLEEVLNK